MLYKPQCVLIRVEKHFTTPFNMLGSLTIIVVNMIIVYKEFTVYIMYFTCCYHYMISIRRNHLEELNIKGLEANVVVIWRCISKLN